MFVMVNELPIAVKMPKRHHVKDRGHVQKKFMFTQDLEQSMFAPIAHHVAPHVDYHLHVILVKIRQELIATYLEVELFAKVPHHADGKEVNAIN